MDLENTLYKIDAPLDIDMRSVYMDRDIIFLDNVKSLRTPDTIKLKMNFIVFCSCGRIQADINGEHTEIHNGQILICPPGLAISNIMVSPEFEFQALGITNNALQMFLRSYMTVWNQFIYVQQSYTIDSNRADMSFYDKMCSLIRMCLLKTNDETEKKYRTEIFKSLLSGCLIGLCNMVRKQTVDTESTPMQNTPLFNQFLDLLQNTEQKHQTVEYYASKLCITPKYLTVICKKNSAKTAVEWITEYTLADIAHYIRNTPLSIKEISNKIGFPNTSFFGKYVKDHFGCTPIEYRKQQ